MWIGVDFGTTHSAAAVYSGDACLEVLHLDNENKDSQTLRTILYLERNGHISIGKEAIENFYQQNAGRIPKLTQKMVGTVKNYDAGMGNIIQDVYAMVDEEIPGRLIHSLKSMLANSSYEGTKIFDRFYKIEDLIAEFLSLLRYRIESSLNRQIVGVVFGRPVNFAGAMNDVDNQFAQERLEYAARLAGFKSVIFEMEPIAAALQFKLQHNITNKHVLVFDFGGGTFDVATVQIDQNGFSKVLAVGGIGIAGDVFDQLIFRHLLLPWFGSGVEFGPKKLPFPKHYLETILEWQEIPSLYSLENLTFLHQVQENCSHPFRIFALEDLIARNCGFPLFQVVEACKMFLSKKSLSTISFEEGIISLWQPLTRRQFEYFIANEKMKIREVINDTLNRADRKPKDIDYIVRIGGSSKIPTFVDMLHEMFGHERVIEGDIFTGVASGLAIQAYLYGIDRKL